MNSTPLSTDITQTELERDGHCAPSAVAFAMKNLLSGTKAPISYRQISAHPDGNCAFNAFILGFCDLLISGALDHLSDLPFYRDFTEAACRALNLPKENWNILKHRVKAMENESVELQTQLAPLFRCLAVELYQPEDLFSALSAEFREYVYALLGIEIHESSFKGGDIFKPIDCIKTVFKKIAATWIPQVEPDISRSLTIYKLNPELLKPLLDPLLEMSIKLLDLWWNQENGFHKFKATMNGSGKWAGDIELGHLGDLFQINVNLRMAGHWRSINEFYGLLPEQHGFSQEELTVLRDRDVIKRKKRPNDPETFKEISREQLKERLMALPDAEEILTYFFEFKAGVIPNDAWIPGLKARDLVSQKNGKYYFIGDIDNATFIARISEFHDKQRILSLYDAHYGKAPHIDVSNPESHHWYYMKRIPTPNPGRAAQALFATTTVDCASATTASIVDESCSHSGPPQ